MNEIVHVTAKPLIEETLLVEMKTFEKVIADEMVRIRERLLNYPTITTMTVNISCSGAVHHGELKVTFEINSGYGSASAKSHTMKTAVDEFLRRHGFDDKNNGLVIGYTGDTART